VLNRPENAFLKSLSDSAFALLTGHLTPYELLLTTHVQDTAVATNWVYFPVTSLLSTIVLGHGGESVEASMVGAEGAAGLTEACGSRISAVECIVQVGGSAWRAPSSALRALVSSSPNFAENAWRAAELQLAEARQSGLCHALHPIEKRLARWLLESMERSGNRNPLPMTQEFLSDMLGVQRTTVTGLALKMQDLGVIRYSRGQLTIVDPMRLEGLACGCRRAMQDQRTRLGFSMPAAAAELV
jgi:CRP-like cAMP-binding protein